MMVHRRRPLLSAAIGCTLLSLAGPAAAAPRTHIVVIDKMKFGAVPTNLRVGDVILWDNRDIFRHSATASGRFDVDLPAGKAVKMPVTASGSVRFLCKYHPGMTGVLKVAK